jgi:L-fuconolactonase
MRIDAHQHFWCYQEQEFSWITPQMHVLRSDHLPAALAPELARHGLDASIAVQARCDAAETDFLLALARDHRRIAGVIGWVDLRAADLRRRLARWEGADTLKGFRHTVQDEPDAAAYLADSAFNRGVTQLQHDGKVYEVLLRSAQLGAAPAFCAAHDAHWLVLDHLGKPAIGGDGDVEWRQHLAALARLPHVVCKISGLVTETGTNAVSDADFHRYLDDALELFGAQRLLFGSDWPVCLLAASYERVYSLIDTWAAQRLSADEAAAVFGDNARRVYGLAENA